MNKPTQSEIAMAITSEHPPTNTNLLEIWKSEAKDADLQVLIACWVGRMEGTIKSELEFYDDHQKVSDKLREGFYSEEPK